jgi:tetratricopeptide (TPR) repeat protein
MVPPDANDLPGGSFTMAKPFLPLPLLLAALVIAATSRATADSSQQPLRQAQLLALVAGNALPDLVRDIGIDGLAFHPDDGYRSILKDAGADPTVLKAVDGAKVIIADGREDRADRKLLEHISTAGKLINQKQYDAAADELTAAVTESFKSPECGFVMGELLRRQKKWGRAAAVYQEVLRQDPSFPEAHTKVSFVLHRGGDNEEALREAKAALDSDSDNAEAHKNAALALGGMKKFDAAQAEYKEALRLKPDYGAVHTDLALLFMDKDTWDDAIAEYRKAVALGAGDADVFYNLGYAYDQKATKPPSGSTGRPSDWTRSGTTPDRIWEPLS